MWKDQNFSLNNRIFCGERACPALGCVAAPIKALQCVRQLRGCVLGLLRSPTRGKPARHNSPLATGDSSLLRHSAKPEIYRDLPHLISVMFEIRV